MRSARRLTACALTAAALAPSGSAVAAPTATVRAYASTAFYVTGSDNRRYLIAIKALAADPANGTPPMVVVIAERCASTCSPVMVARLPVAPAAVTIATDDSAAHATATFGGALTASWTSGPLPALPGIQTWDTPTVRVGTQRDAHATATVFGLTCQDTNAVIGHGATVSTADLHTPRTATIPAAFRRTAKRAPRCE